MAAAMSTGPAEKHKGIFVLGGPGAGKGTQCQRLVDEFGLTHLSVGELLRQARSAGTSEGKLIDDYIKEGKIVPVRLFVLRSSTVRGAVVRKKLLIPAHTRFPYLGVFVARTITRSDGHVVWFILPCGRVSTQLG